MSKTVVPAILFEFSKGEENRSEPRWSRRLRETNLFLVRGRHVRSNDIQTLPSLSNWLPKHKFQRHNGFQPDQTTSPSSILAENSELCPSPNSKSSDIPTRLRFPTLSPSAGKSLRIFLAGNSENTSNPESNLSPDANVVQGSFCFNSKSQQSLFPNDQNKSNKSMEWRQNTIREDSSPSKEAQCSIQPPVLQNWRNLEENLQERTHLPGFPSRHRSHYNETRSRFNSPEGNHLNSQSTEDVGTNVKHMNLALKNDVSRGVVQNSNIETGLSSSLSSRTEVNSLPERCTTGKQSMVRRGRIKGGIGHRRTCSWGSGDARHRAIKFSLMHERKQVEIKELYYELRDLQLSLFNMEQKVFEYEHAMQHVSNQLKKTLSGLYNRVEGLRLVQDVEYTRVADMVIENQTNLSDLDRQMDYALTILGSGRRYHGLMGHFRGVSEILVNVLWELVFKTLGFAVSTCVWFKEAIGRRD